MAHYYLVDGNKKINKWKIKNLVYDQVIRFYQKYLAHVDPWVRYRDVERYCYELAAALFDLDQYDIIHTQDIISTRALSRVKPSRTALVATIHGLLAKEHMIAGDIESKDSLAWKYVADEEYYGCVSANAAILPTEWLRREMVRFSVPRTSSASYLMVWISPNSSKDRKRRLRSRFRKQRNSRSAARPGSSRSKAIVP